MKCDILAQIGRRGQQTAHRAERAVRQRRFFQVGPVRLPADIQSRAAPPGAFENSKSSRSSSAAEDLCCTYSLVRQPDALVTMRPSSAKA